MKYNVGHLHDCFGCTACGGVCPVNIIEIIKENGFYKPTITNQDKCIECGICMKTCSFNTIGSEESQHDNIVAYASQSINNKTISTSTSGGILPELINTLLHKGYSILAVRFNYSSNQPEYYEITSPSGIEESKGSKYLQANVAELIKNIDWKKKYAIIGTPCLIASIKNLIDLRKKNKNFILIDFFCHGVPSYNLWLNYLYYHNINPLDIKHVKFRSKQFGWHQSIRTRIVTENSIFTTVPPQRDIFFSWFLGDRCLNKACYDNCRFKQLTTNADIRVGDLWGKKYLDNEQGLSGLVTFSKRGNDLIKECGGISNTLINPHDVLEGQMKNNAKRPLSYRVAQIGLSHKTLFGLINNMCDVIDFLYKFPRRLRNKINSLKNA